MSSFKGKSEGSIAYSVVIPVYREDGSLIQIAKSLVSCRLPDEVSEIIFVNDGNRSNAVTRLLSEIQSSFANVRVIHLARNFGQHSAIAAGIRNSRGKYVLIMDADLQYTPLETMAMLRWAQEQQKPAVISIIPNRNSDLLRRLGSQFFYAVMTFLGVPQRSDLGSAFVINREVAFGLCRMNDRVRMTIPMIFWLVGEVDYYEVTHEPRAGSRSGYSLLRLAAFAIRGAISFSTKPLYFAFVMAAIYGILSVTLGGRFLLGKLLWNETYLAGWASTVILVSISTAVILGAIGIVGLYMASVFESTQGRPLYFVRNHSESDLFED